MRFDSCAQEKATRWRDTGCSQLANFGGIARHDREPGRHACVCGHNTVVLPRHRDAGPEEITNRGRSKMSITWIQVGSSHSTKGYTHPPLLSYGLHVAAWRPEPGAAESCILRPARLKLTICIYNLFSTHWRSAAGAPHLLSRSARTRLPAGFKPPQTSVFTTLQSLHHRGARILHFSWEETGHTENQECLEQNNFFGRSACHYERCIHQRNTAYLSARQRRRGDWE